MSGTAPALTVIVPTHDRRAMLTRLLDALARGGVSDAELEVIVVADGCTDDTLAALAARHDPFALRVIARASAGGPGRARDLGAGAATGDTLLFIDDDIEPLAGALAVHTSLHAAARTRGEELLVIGAPIPARSRGHDYHMISAWGWWEQQFERMGEPGHRFRHEEIFTGMLSISTSAFRAVGGFDVTFSDCHEDWELGLRLFRRGVRITFARDAGGIHHDLRDLPRLIARKRDEGRADVLLAERNPELWPALRLSSRDARPWTLLGALRRLAFSAPRVGDGLLTVLARLLGPLERLRLRGSWRAVQGAVMYFSYWRGAASQLGGPAQLAALAASVAPAAAAATARAEDQALEIELRDGLTAAERAIDAVRPVALRVRLDGHEVGLVPAVPGAEPLRGEHLRRLLALDLARPLSIAIELSEVSAGTDAGVLA